MSSEAQIPTEILQAIFSLLSPADKESLSTLVRCTSLNKRIRSVITLPSIWEPHYKFRWRRSDPVKEADRLQRMAGDWYALAVERGKLDHKASVLLDTMLAMQSSTKKFMELAKEIVDDLGRDIWDYMNSKVCTFSLRDQSDSHWLSRSYWAKEIIGVLEKRVAIVRLQKLVSSQPMPLEEGLSILSAFWSVDYESIRWELDELASKCYTYLSELWNHLPNSDEMQLETVCKGICDWMSTQGFGPVEPAGYYAVSNSFLHLALKNAKQTLPLTLVAVFVAIAQRLGLEAYPVSFPGAVHATVRHPTDGSSIAVDLFNASSRLFPSEEYLVAMLETVGVRAENAPLFMAPASTRDMVYRASANISNAVSRSNQEDALQWESAWASYASAMVQILARPQSIAASTQAKIIRSLYRHLPLDYELVVQSHVIPAIEGSASKTLLDVLRGDATPESGFVRTGRDIRGKIKSHVGLLMYHTYERWVGVVFDQRDVNLGPDMEGGDTRGVLLRVCHSPPGSPTVIFSGPQKVHRANPSALFAVRWPTTPSSGVETDPSTLELHKCMREAWGDLDALLETMPEIGRKFRDVRVDEQQRVRFIPGPDVEGARLDDPLPGLDGLGI